MAPRLQRRPHGARQPDRRGRESPSPLVRRRPSPTTRPHSPGGLRARASRFTAHVCTLVSEEHGTAPRIRMPTSTSGGAEPLEARRWRPLRELGKVCFNGRCAARSKGAFGPVAIRGPFPQAGQRTTRRGVGKHPAPPGALRRFQESSDLSPPYVGKHPAPPGALRPDIVDCGLSWYRRTGIIY